MERAINPGPVPYPIGGVDQNICDGTFCISLPAVAQSIRQQLDCNVVGYAFFVGNAMTGPKSVFGSYGQARTQANPPQAKFTPDSRMQIASASKVLTALAALKVMSSNVNKPASTYFPPSWTLPANSIVQPITVRRFISQTSGVMAYDAGQEDDASLKTFFTQNLDPNAQGNCDTPVPPNPPIVATSQPCYSNANFSLMRVVLPRAAGNTSSDPQTLADAYVSQVWQNVFFPVGANAVRCQGLPTASYALGYNFPATQPGTDFGNGGDLRLSCGAWGWWVSVRDYAAVLVSLNAQDGKILGNCGLNDMVTNPASHPVGWDTKTDGTHRWVEKNGGDSWGTANGTGIVSTSVVLYGGRDGCVVKGRGIAPIPGVAAVLFINSNLRGSDPVGMFSGTIGGGGMLTLSGSLVVGGGLAKTGVPFPHYVVAASSNAGDTTQKLAIMGTKSGNVISETITLNGTTAVGSANSYDTVTKIVASGSGYPTAGSISIGTNGVGADSVLLNALWAGTTAQ